MLAAQITNVDGGFLYEYRNSYNFIEQIITELYYRIMHYKIL